jgi:hypothetical protein
MRGIYVYCLAVAAARHGVLVHAFAVMSNHHHLIITDVRGTLPDFLRELHRLLALCVKVLRKWDGPVWDHRAPSVVRLCTPAAVLEAMAYVIANPVVAGLVESARDWPGLLTLPGQLGSETFVAQRPPQYFDPNNPRWPEQASLALSMPDLPDLRADEVRDAIKRQVAELEQKARADLRLRGWAVRGAHRCLAASPYDRAETPEALCDRTPTFAVGKGQHQAYALAARELRLFRTAYANAMARWRAGDRGAEFPPGTWRMRVLHAACVADVSIREAA